MQKDMQVTVALVGVDKLNPKVREAVVRIKDLESRTLGARDKLKQLAISDRGIRSLDNMRQKMGALSNELKVAQANLAGVTRQMKLGNATQADLDKATSAVQRLKGEYDKLGQAAVAARKKLTDQGVGNIEHFRAGLPSQMAQAQARLDRENRMVAIRARNAALQDKVAPLSVGGVAMTGAGMGILGGLGSTGQVAAGHAAEMRQIALTADMTDARMQALSRTIVRTSDAVGQSTEALRSGVGFLIAAGSAPEVAERSIAAIGKVATTYKADVLEISQSGFVLTDTLNILPEKLQGAFGIMAKAGKEGNVELRDMAKVLPTLGPGMVALKMQGEEATATMAAALQIARKGAPTADIAANNMQNFLTKVMSPETLKKATENFGLDLYGVISKAQSSGANPVEAALDAISRVTKGGDQKLLGDLFQDMQVQGFLRPMLQNMDEYRRIKAEALAAANGTMIDDDFARSAQDADRVFARLGNAWDNIKLKVGEGLAPALVPIAEMFGRAANAVVDFADRHPKLMQVLVILAGLLGALLVVGGGAMLVIASMVIPFAALSVAAGALGIGLLPLVLIIGGIAAAVAAVVALFVYWEDVVGFFMTKWEELKFQLSVVGEFFLSIGVAIIDGLVNPILQGGVRVVNAILSVVSKGVAAVKDFLGIRSPSRVFAQIGGFTAAGLAMGMAQGTPAVVSTAENMARQVSAVGVPGVGAGGGAGAAGGFSIGQVTIVIDGASGDPAAIAKAVEDQLRKMASRSRSDAAARFYED